MKYTAGKREEQFNVFVYRSNALLIAGKWEEALSDAENALETNPKESAALINKCIALKKLNRQKEAEKILQDALLKMEDKYQRAGAFAVLGNKKNMLKELEAAIKEDIGNRVDAKFDPDFAEYREDPDFRKIVYKGQK